MNAPVLIGLVCSLGTLAFVFELLRRRRLRGKYAVLWLTVAVTSLLLTLVPGTLSWLSHLVGFEVPSNLLFFAALVLLLLTNIQHSYEVGRLEEKCRTLAEEIALLRLDIDRRGESEPSE